MSFHAQSVGATRYVGERVARKEDRLLLTGHGQFTDDVQLPGTLHVAFLRSPVARGRIVSAKLEAARALPGVHAIYGQSDLDAMPVGLISFFFTPIQAPVKLLAEGRVACVGDPIFMVLAEDRAIAEDAVATIELTIEEEAPIVTIADAKRGAPVHPGIDDNIAAEMGDEDALEGIQPLIDAASHTVRLSIQHQRIAQSPMEGRACVAHWQGGSDLQIWMSCQSPHLVARYMSMVLDVPVHSIRVVAKDVGGAFGLKNIPWREEVAVVVAARLCGQPVKWIEDRYESLTASSHAREQEATITAGFDAQGRLTAAWCDYACNNGAWPMGEDANIAVHMFMWLAYRMPAYGFISRGWYTNTMGLGGYRGPWAIETLLRETLLDKAARKIGIDPVEIRRRNLFRRSELPHTTGLGLEVADITPLECLEKLVEQFDIPAFREEQHAARAEGRYLGLGIAAYVEPTAAAGGMPAMTGETAAIRIEPTGKVVATLSTHSQGHGTATTMAQIIADRLGVPYDDVSVFEGDSTLGAYGPGAAGSRQGVIAGGASWRAAEQLAEKVKVVAAHIANANVESIRIESGVVHVAGAPEMSRSLREVAEIAYGEPTRLPPGLETGLESRYRYQPPPFTFTSAAHLCVVEVDADTGFVKILRWLCSEDCGTVIHPGVVEGQIAGGLAQGIGQVLLEEMPYDAAGNPLAATFKDYLMPAISDIPDFEYIHANTPSQTIGGMRGVGEGGAIIGPPTLVNAIADALEPFGGIDDLTLPMSPTRILSIVEGRDLSRLSAPVTVSEPFVPPVSSVEDAAGETRADAIAGAWAMVLKTPMGPQEMTALFAVDGDKLSGELQSPEGSQPFSGSVSGTTLKWEMVLEKPMKMTLKYNLVVEGQTMSGKCKMGMFGTAKVSGQKLEA